MIYIDDIMFSFLSSTYFENVLCISMHPLYQEYICALNRHSDYKVKIGEAEQDYTITHILNRKNDTNRSQECRGKQMLQMREHSLSP